MNQRRWYLTMLTLGLALIAIRIGYEVLFVSLTPQDYPTSSPHTSSKAVNPRWPKPSSPAQARLQQIQKCIANGDLDKAIQLCETEASINPQVREFAYLAWLYRETGQKEKVASCLRKAQLQCVGDLSAPSQLTRFLIHRGMDEEAESVIEGLLKQDRPLCPDLHASLLLLYSHQRKGPELARLIADTMKVDAGATSFYGRSGHALLSIGQVGRGIAQLKRGVTDEQSYDNSHECFHLIMYTYLVLGQVTEARSYQQSLRPGWDKDPWLECQVLMAEGKWKQAQKVSAGSNRGEWAKTVTLICKARADGVTRVSPHRPNYLNRNDTTPWAGREAGLRWLRSRDFDIAADAFLKADEELVYPTNSWNLGDHLSFEDYPNKTLSHAETEWPESGFPDQHYTHNIHGWIGLQTSEIVPPGSSSSDGHGSRGVLVCRVVPGSPAEKAGMRAGDRVTNLNGGTISKEADWYKLLAKINPGQPVSLTVESETESKLVDMKAGAWPQ